MVAESQKDSLEFVREIRATPERVFRTSTTPVDLMECWGATGLQKPTPSPVRKRGYCWDKPVNNA